MLCCVAVRESDERPGIGVVAADMTGTAMRLVQYMYYEHTMY